MLIFLKTLVMRHMLILLSQYVGKMSLLFRLATGEIHHTLYIHFRHLFIHFIIIYHFHLSIFISHMSCNDLIMEMLILVYACKTSSARKIIGIIYYWLLW